MSKSKCVSNKHIRKGDKVIVIAGDDRGAVGTVLSRTPDRVVVQGVNVCKKTVKRSEANPRGGTVAVERSVDASNVRLLNAEGKAIKTRVRTANDGKREVFYREGTQEVPLRSVRNSK